MDEIIEWLAVLRSVLGLLKMASDWIQSLRQRKGKVQ